MKMSFKLALLCLGLSLTYANAQVGMPTNNPNKDAVLDLNRTDGTSAKGLLLPRVALSGGITSATPMVLHVAGMHVWNTATVTGTNGVTPGEYFNDGSKWIRVSSDAWIQGGNSNGVLKAIGTNDNFDLPVATNGAEKMRVTSGGQVLVNTTTSMTGGTTAKLQINNGTTAGAIQIKDGTQGVGKVLTSDANGLATWAPATNFMGIWSLGNSGQAFTNGVYSKETGSSSISPGDQLGLVAGTNSVTVPAGRYIVFVSHDIGGWEIGDYQIRSSTGTVVLGVAYSAWLSTSFVLDSPSSITLESYFRPALFAGSIYLQPPYTAGAGVTLTFLKM